MSVSNFIETTHKSRAFKIGNFWCLLEYIRYITMILFYFLTVNIVSSCSYHLIKQYNQTLIFYIKKKERKKNPINTPCRCDPLNCEYHPCFSCLL